MCVICIECAGKSYDSPDDEKLRFKQFAVRIKEIAQHNAAYDKGQATYTKELNHLADLVVSGRSCSLKVYFLFRPTRNSVN
jgi:propanediol dehydratase small subunit